MMCGKPKANSAFYKSRSTFHSDGLIPICRKCILNSVFDPLLEELNVDKFQNILRQIDKPFIKDVLTAAEQELRKKYPTKKGQEKVKTQIGLYFKNINSLPQYQSLTWDNSKFDLDDFAPTQTGGNTNRQIVYIDGTTELFSGYGFTTKQMEYLRALYNLLQDDYYHITAPKQRNMLASFVKDCLHLQNAIALNDDSMFVDCIKDIINVSVNPPPKKHP